MKTVAPANLNARRDLYLQQTTPSSHTPNDDDKGRSKNNNETHSPPASESPRKKRRLDDDRRAIQRQTNSQGHGTDDPRRQKRQNSVWVGNLSFRTTQEALRGFFDGVGTITRIHMPMRCGRELQNENMGFAYVDFEMPDAKVIAITLSEGHLDGRRLLIKDGDDFTGRPARVNAESLRGEGETSATKGTTADGKALSKTAQKILRTQKQPPAQTLFLGNLGFDTTEKSIRELFEAHRNWRHSSKKMDDQDEVGDRVATVERRVDTKGSVHQNFALFSWFILTIRCLYATGDNRFAFVDFTSIEHATEVLVNPRNHCLNGRDLVVEYASPDAVRRGGGGPRNPKLSRNQKGRGGGENKSPRIPHKGSTNTPYTKQRRPRPAEAEGADDAEIPAGGTTSRSRQSDRAGRDRGYTRRARPGAALAQAQRQSAAILPSQGQKIMF
ncbi:hypothetical protein JVU11DRAFT_1958 [Chiua virens]|nr:hypothetical protein JVU11DRAFT_1958 [Chiua virens]